MYNHRSISSAPNLALYFDVVLGVTAKVGRTYLAAC
jgi:hypothetical protein